MPVLRAIASLGKLSGLDEDRIVNTFHFATVAEPDVAEATALVPILQTFYQAIDDYFSEVIDNTAGAHTLQFYNVTSSGPGPDDDVTGSPILSSTFTTPTDAGANLSMPDEVAVCLSMNGVLTDIPEEVGATRPAARRRGRIYIGPLAVTARTLVANESRVAPAFVTVLLNAAEAMYDAAVAAGATPAVYSRQDNLAYPIQRYSVDNAFDTVRSRGVARSGVTHRVVNP